MLYAGAADALCVFSRHGDQWEYGTPELPRNFAISSQKRRPGCYKDGMWRSRILWRLFGAYGVLLAVSFVGLDWLVISRMESHLLQEIQHELEVKTLLLQDLVGRHEDTDLQSQVIRIGKATSTRITLIEAGGRVLADSGEDPSRMENHGARPEVQQAEKSEFGV